MRGDAAGPGRGLSAAVVIGWCAAAATIVVIYLVVASGTMLLLGRGATPTLASSVAATALVAVAVRPVRRGVEQAVAGRLPSVRPSPYELLASATRTFSDAESDAVPAVIARMLALGTGVPSAEVWVVVGGQPRLVASYPPSAQRTPLAVPLPFQAQQPDGFRVVTVTNGREPLGVLRVRERPGHPMTAVEEGLLTGLAAQAGMVLQRAQLRAELALRLDELIRREAQLRRSRLELVAAQDRERRRLERDIHDGAQQQLVALAINLKLARALWDSDQGAARQVLTDQLEAVPQVIATLTDLSGGLLPHSLAEHGLVRALSEATSGSPVPVAVRGDEVPRQPPSVEATVYFCVLEAVQNATKHAGATQIVVRLQLRRSELVVEVDDDGRGMPGTAVEGGGLTNLRERAAVLGGRIAVASPAGRGTTITITVPVAESVGAQ